MSSQQKSPRKGFTIIEVSLVLAITGLILVGVISGLGGSVARQRYNDSVQSIAERFRVIYNQAANPQSIADNSGTTDAAIYGKLAIISSDSTQGNAVTINSYTVIGDAESNKASESSATLSALLGASPRVRIDSIDLYTAPWEARLQPQGKLSDEELYDTDDSRNIKGTILIIHSPNGGAIHTYYSSQSVSDPLVANSNEPSLSNIVNTSLFSNTAPLNFCVNSPDLSAAGGIRRNIRIAKDGRNSSAVELIDVNGDDNACNK